jgi:hypothetical protein
MHILSNPSGQKLPWSSQLDTVTNFTFTLVLGSVHLKATLTQPLISCQEKQDHYRPRVPSQHVRIFPPVPFQVWSFPKSNSSNKDQQNYNYDTSENQGRHSPLELKSNYYVVV